MTIEPADFRRALGQLVTGVTVVTTVDRSGDPLGLTASAVCSVSLSPPLILVCVGAHSEAHEGFRHFGRFGVSVLAEDQEAFSRSFAQPGPEKFVGAPMVRGEGGLSFLQGALAHLECRVAASHPAGDHTIYVGEVVRLAVFGGDPLLYHRGGYHGVRMLGGGR
jgi:flavin reductase (DIM6/NTAB) family NADH-FMN oxidoreductase RutF